MKIEHVANSSVYHHWGSLAVGPLVYTRKFHESGQAISWNKDEKAESVYGPNNRSLRRSKQGSQLLQGRHTIAYILRKTSRIS